MGWEESDLNMRLLGCRIGLDEGLGARAGVMGDRVWWCYTVLGRGVSSFTLFWKIGEGMFGMVA